MCCSSRRCVSPSRASVKASCSACAPSSNSGSRSAARRASSSAAARRVVSRMTRRRRCSSVLSVSGFISGTLRSFPPGGMDRPPPAVRVGICAPLRGVARSGGASRETVSPCLPGCHAGRRHRAGPLACRHASRSSGAGWPAARRRGSSRAPALPSSSVEMKPGAARRPTSSTASPSWSARTRSAPTTRRTPWGCCTRSCAGSAASCSPRPTRRGSRRATPSRSTASASARASPRGSTAHPLVAASCGRR